MSNFSDFIGGGGGGGGLPVNIILGYSQTWVPPVDGNICIHVVGAGGGGSGGDATGSIFSGGAGAYCKKNSLAVTTSGSFTVVVGAGGAGVSAQGDGNNGGNTTVAGTGLSSTLTANGGTGGIWSGHGTGGTAANGDVNNTGGAGSYQGGGAVGITGTGNTASSGLPANCDVIGPSSLMGYGYICGESGGKLCENETVYDDDYGVHNINSATTGGFLSGGGSFIANGQGLEYVVYGGDGGIGGGGGGTLNVRSSTYSRAGNGGNGIVIIQYLPA